MNTYLNDNDIKRISNNCKNVLNPNTKAKLQAIEKKYNIELTIDRQSNMNTLWLTIQNKLKTENTMVDPISKHTFADQLREGGGIAVREMIYKYFDKNPDVKADYQFICDFNPEQLISKCREITRTSHLEFSLTLAQLLKVQDYEKYFSLKYGISSIDREAAKNTQRIADFFDQLFKGVPNRNFNAIMEYLEHKNISILHNTLHYHE